MYIYGKHPNEGNAEASQEEIEKALGIKLYQWQKCLWRLLVNDRMPRKLTRIIYESADAKERFEQRMLIEIMQKLKAAGVECNTFVLRKRHMHTGERGKEVRWP